MAKKLQQQNDPRAYAGSDGNYGAPSPRVAKIRQQPFRARSSTEKSPDRQL